MLNNDTNLWQLNIVILTAVRNEHETAMKFIDDLAESSDHETYLWTEEETASESALVGFGKKIVELRATPSLVLRMIFLKLPDPGSGGDAATFLATKAIHSYRPYAICMVGMCAGNQKAKIKLKDVVVASSVIRHDYGGLELDCSSKSTDSLTMKHRVTGANYYSISDTGVFEGADFYEEINAYNEAISDHKVVSGVFTSGNQIVRVPGVFEYLTKRARGGVAGEVDHRNILALEMESFSVAYSASKSNYNIGWIVAKGVADYATGSKNKRAQKDATLNALRFIFNILPGVVNKSFSRRFVELDSAQKDLKFALGLYEDGDIGRSSVIFENVYNRGFRGPLSRKHYLKSLMRMGDYELAENCVREHSNRPWFQDAITADMQAELYYRKGNYSKMKSILDSATSLTSSQLEYQNSLSIVFNGGYKSKRNLSRAVKHIKKAIDIQGDVRKFFLHVNYCFILRLQQKIGAIGEEKVVQEYNIALDTLTFDIRKHPDRGLLHIYRLLLFALMDYDDQFDKQVNKESAPFTVALDNVDMVFERIRVVYRDDSTKTDLYIGKLTNFILRRRLVGGVVRDETARTIERHR